MSDHFVECEVVKVLEDLVDECLHRICESHESLVISIKLNLKEFLLVAGESDANVFLRLLVRNDIS